MEKKNDSQLRTTQGNPNIIRTKSARHGNQSRKQNELSKWFKAFYGHQQNKPLFYPWKKHTAKIDVKFETEEPQTDHSLTYKRLVFKVRFKGKPGVLVVNKAIATRIARFQERTGSICGKRATIQKFGKTKYKVDFHTGP